MTRLPTNGARSVTAAPPWQAAEANVVKSPASICAVGTRASSDAGCCVVFGALVRAEEEQTIAHDRPAERAAKLVARQAVVHLLAVGTDRREAADRVEPRVAVELEGIARRTGWCPTS